MKANSRPRRGRDTSRPNRHGAPVGVRPEDPPSSLVEVDLAAQSRAGNAKANNEDHYLVVRLERSLQTLLSDLPEGVLPHSFDETIYGMVVADGMGGMPAGEVASGMAVRALVDLVVKTPDWIMRMNRRKAAVVKRRLIQRFRQVDAALREHSNKDPRLTGMGTTMSVACSLGADLFLAYSGDSRIYLLRGHELHQLTRDHTMAQALIDAKVADAENAVVHGMRRVLTDALGSTLQPSDPEVRRLCIRDGDQVLLCTDGVTECVDSETIGSILRNAISANEACRALIDAALRAGGNDDMTVVLARYRFPQMA